MNSDHSSPGYRSGSTRLGRHIAGKARWTRSVRASSGRTRSRTSQFVPRPDEPRHRERWNAEIERAVRSLRVLSSRFSSVPARFVAQIGSITEDGIAKTYTPGEDERAGGARRPAHHPTRSARGRDGDALEEVGAREQPSTSTRRG